MALCWRPTLTTAACLLNTHLENSGGKQLSTDWLFKLEIKTDALLTLKCVKESWGASVHPMSLHIVEGTAAQLCLAQSWLVCHPVQLSLAPSLLLKCSGSPTHCGHGLLCSDPEGPSALLLSYFHSRQNSTVMTEAPAPHLTTALTTGKPGKKQPAHSSLIKSKGERTCTNAVCLPLGARPGPQGGERAGRRRLTHKHLCAARHRTE